MCLNLKVHVRLCSSVAVCSRNEQVWFMQRQQPSISGRTKNRLHALPASRRTLESFIQDGSSAGQNSFNQLVYNSELNVDSLGKIFSPFKTKCEII